MRANDEQLEYLQRTVSQGGYQIDSQQVAAAMLERIGAYAVDHRSSVSPKVVVSCCGH